MKKVILFTAVGGKAIGLHPLVEIKLLSKLDQMNPKNGNVLFA
jgi:hypothetical protein